MRAPRRSGPATAPSLLLGVTVGRAREGTREAGSGSPVQSRRPARPMLGTLAGVGGWGRPPGGSTALLPPLCLRQFHSPGCGAGAASDAAPCVLLPRRTRSPGPRT